MNLALLLVQAKTNTWVSKLRQYVADAQVAHGEVRILGRAGGNEPRRARQVGSLRNQQHSSILRVSPESLVPVDRALLNGPVVGVGRVRSAEADERLRSSCRQITKEVALG